MRPHEQRSAGSSESYEPIGEFDPSYEKPIVATIVGSVILAAGLYSYLIERMMTEDELSVYRWVWIFIRIGAGSWCVYLAKQQNRYMIGWGLFGLIAPGLALIFIGLQEKRRIGLPYGPVFDFEERHHSKNIVTKKTFDGIILTIHTSLTNGYTVGDIVSIDGNPAPSGKYKLDWNHYLTVEGGRILKL